MLLIIPDGSESILNNDQPGDTPGFFDLN